MNKNITQNFNFKNAAIYKIVVNGFIDESWSEKLSEMQIKTVLSSNNRSVTTLVGEIRDQSALSGVLNTLYDMQLAVISVNLLSEIEND